MTIPAPTHKDMMKRLQLHTGAMSQNAARIDQNLTKILSILCGGANPAIAEAIFKGEQVSAKLKFFERALQEVDWPRGKNLIRSIKRLNARRDRMSHSYPSTT